MKTVLKEMVTQFAVEMLNWSAQHLKPQLIPLGETGIPCVWQTSSGNLQ